MTVIDLILQLRGMVDQTGFICDSIVRYCTENNFWTDFLKAFLNNNSKMSSVSRVHADDEVACHAGPTITYALTVLLSDKHAPDVHTPFMGILIYMVRLIPSAIKPRHFIPK